MTTPDDLRERVWQAVSGSLATATGHYGDVVDTVTNSVMKALGETTAADLRERYVQAIHAGFKEAEIAAEIARLHTEVDRLNKQHRHHGATS